MLKQATSEPYFVVSESISAVLLAVHLTKNVDVARPSLVPRLSLSAMQCKPVVWKLGSLEVFFDLYLELEYSAISKLFFSPNFTTHIFPIEPRVVTLPFPTSNPAMLSLELVPKPFLSKLPRFC